jgi:hypothetical protein
LIHLKQQRRPTTLRRLSISWCVPGSLCRAAFGRAVGDLLRAMNQDKVRYVMVEADE